MPREYPDSRVARTARRGAGGGTDAATDPFVEAYLPALLAQAHELVASEFHAIAAEHGLAPSEWRVLATLASGEPTSIGRLARIVVMKQPTVTRLLDRMEATGHVERLPHDADRRITLVGITTAQPAKARSASSSALNVSTSRSLVGSSSSKTLLPARSSFARWTRLRSPPDSSPTNLC